MGLTRNVTAAFSSLRKGEVTQYTELLGRFGGEELERRLDLALAGSHEALDGLPPLAAPAPKRRWGRRHGESGAAQPTWVPTKERFVDPTTERVMRVWIDPTDHVRHYIPD